MLTKNEKIRQKGIETKQKRKSQICRVYTVKVDESKLDKYQKEQLKMLFIESKWFYNHILNWAEEPQNVIYNFNIKNCKSVLVLNKDKVQEERKLQYLTVSLKQTIFDKIRTSIKSISTLKKRGYIKRGGRLKYKSEIKSLKFRQYNVTHYIKGNKIKLLGIKKLLPIRGLRQFIHQEGIEYANFILRNTPNGYYINIVTYIDKDKISTEKPQLDPIGIDFGCTTSFTLSKGEKINFRIEESERLKRLDRKMQRRKKGSNNYNKIKKLRAIEYQKITNKKKDATNKLIHKFKQHKMIVIQDERIAVWQKSYHGNAIFHSILGRVKEKLKQLPQIIILDQFIPTTKLCIECGNSYNISTHAQIFKCPYCGYECDRDIHAAQNMLWIAEVLLNKFIRLGQTKFKRAEFLEAISKFNFDNVEETVKHEAINSDNSSRQKIVYY